MKRVLSGVLVAVVLVAVFAVVIVPDPCDSWNPITRWWYGCSDGGGSGAS